MKKNPKRPRLSITAISAATHNALEGTMKNLIAVFLALNLIASSAFAAEPAKCADKEYNDTVSSMKAADKICEQKDAIKADFVKLGCDEAKVNAGILAVCPEPSKAKADAKVDEKKAGPAVAPVTQQSNTECQQAAEALNLHGGEETFGRLATFLDGLIKNDIAGPKAAIDQNPDGDGMMAFNTLEPALSGTLAELEKAKKISHDEATVALNKVKACFTSIGKKVVITTSDGNTVQGEVTSVSSESLGVFTTDSSQFGAMIPTVGATLIDRKKYPWMPPLRFSFVYNPAHFGTGIDNQYGRDFTVVAKGFEIGGELSMDGSWRINSWMSGVYSAGVFAGYRETNFRSELAQDGKFGSSNGITVGVVARAGLNLAGWVSVYGLGKARALPWGYDLGGGVELTRVSVVRFGVELTHGQAFNQSRTGYGPSAPANFGGTSVTARVGVGF